MKDFFDEILLLNNKTAIEIYNKIKYLPIIDYHCHLNEKQINDNKSFHDIGELWLSGDHYKWRAMRLCKVDESYITGNKSYKEKFFKYAEIMPKLIGNPIYYWSHMELNNIFNINEPLNIDSAEKIYQKANNKLEQLSVKEILKLFKVEYIATTDDPISELTYHGIYEKTKVAPTFRPDRIFRFEKDYIKKLSTTAEIKIITLEDLKNAYKKRLEYFITKGCKIADHGMDILPTEDISKRQAEKLFEKCELLKGEEKQKLFSHLMYFFAELYKKHNITMQLHFATFRNINSKMYETIGTDSGFDVMRGNVDTDSLARFLNNLNSSDNLPKTILYSLNPSVIPVISAISGAFKNVLIGSAWWFNDTVEGIKKQLSVISEYSVLGTNLGMLTDSRSFTSYVRFDFFRRILADFIGNLVEKGEYDINSAIKIAENISYNNTKEFLGL